MKKKIIIISISLIALISLTLFVSYKFISNKKENANKVLETHESTDVNTENEESDNKNEDQEESKTDDSKNEVEEVQEEPKQETTNKNSTTSSNTSSNNNNVITPKQEEVPTQNNVTQEPTPTPSCTPRKFYTQFRADFDSFEECNFNGIKYKQELGYLGFVCDYTTDDCGVTYYMLSFFDNTGTYYGYDTIPKP